MSFLDLGLDPNMLRAVDAMGFTEATPIQEQAIPLVLSGKDIVGCAQTGTGKTVAFILPTLQRLPKGQGVRGLVVTPTRELARQIVEVASEASRFTQHRVTAVYGGVKYGDQIDRLRKGVDLLVATPGRLLDLVGRKEIDLGRVEVFTLDEADRMLDMGFWPDVRKIVRMLPEKRQNLLFSATMSPDVLRVIESTLDDPVSVEVGPRAIPVDEVHQAVYPVAASQKAKLLIALLDQLHLDRVLVFTRTKQTADRVHRTLRRTHVSAEVIHSDRNQSQRQQALDGFKTGKHRVLVATDIVARGIDVEDISHVVNYDMPENPEDYVHRVGRTARAGATGHALSFCAASDTPHLREIEYHLGKVIPCEDVEGFHYSKRAVPNPDRSADKTTRPVFYGGVMKRRRPGRITRR